VIRDRGGVIDKYIGDAVMPLFPGPADDARRAAIAMQCQVAYNVTRRERGYPSIAIGVGLHTGDLMLGTVGEAERMNSTVISNNVNLASRLEGVTRCYGASIVISGATLALLSRDAGFRIRFLDRIQVKGKREPVQRPENLPARHYVERSERLARQDMPEDCDGALTMETE
jgi:two-component system sensor histidine kinase ChiS